MLTVLHNLQNSQVTVCLMSLDISCIRPFFAHGVVVDHILVHVDLSRAVKIVGIPHKHINFKKSRPADRR